MTNLKNHKRYGFSLIEVLIALSIAAIVFAPILISYGTALRGVGYYVQLLERIRFAQNFLIDRARQMRLTKETSKKVEQAISDPEMKLTFVQDTPPKESSLSSIADLQRQRITMKWGNNVEEQIVTFVYLPQEPNAEQPKVKV